MTMFIDMIEAYLLLFTSCMHSTSLEVDIGRLPRAG